MVERCVCVGVCSFLWERGFLLVLVCCEGFCFRGVFWGGGEGEGGRLMGCEGLNVEYV